MSEFNSIVRVLRNHNNIHAIRVGIFYFNFVLYQYILKKIIEYSFTTFRRFLKAIIWHSEWIVPEIRLTLKETQKREQLFSGSFKALLELFKTLDSSLHVEELMKLKVGKDVDIRVTIQQMSECLADKGLQDFSERVINDVLQYNPHVLLFHFKL